MRSSARPSSPVRLALAGLAAAFLFVGACGSDHPPVGEEVQSTKSRITAPAVTGDDLATLAADNRHFAVDLYQSLRATPGNVIFSPESISFALAMTYGGAEGTTAAQMATALHFSLPPERLHPAFNELDLALASRGAAGGGAFQLRLADALWAQSGFTILPAYLDLLAENYGAGVHLVDFIGAAEAARASINQWVSDQTAGKISELLTPGAVDASTRLVLANAVYFNADWATPFDHDSPSGTGTFHAPAGDVSVEMMQGPTSIPLWSGAGYQAAAVPYVGQTTSMVLIVPDAGTFDTFEAALTGDVLDGILAAQSASSGGLSMPKFAFKEGVSLKTLLSGLGMTDAFTSDVADFSGIDGARDLFVGDVIHQALIAVDEKGTTAAASTAVIIRDSAATLNNLVVDRPFLFLIRDDATSSILFLGRVVDPSAT